MYYPCFVVVVLTLLGPWLLLLLLCVIPTLEWPLLFAPPAPASGTFSGGCLPGGGCLLDVFPLTYGPTRRWRSCLRICFVLVSAVTVVVTSSGWDSASCAPILGIVGAMACYVDLGPVCRCLLAFVGARSPPFVVLLARANNYTRGVGILRRLP